MKRFRLFTAALVAGLACAGSAFADTDVTSTYLNNAGFDTESDYVKTGICTYASDVAGNGADGSSLMAVTGWTVSGSGDGKAGGCFQFGGSAWVTGTSFVVPATGSDGTATGGALGIGACWGADAYYSQDLKANLPAGDYTIEICAYNANTTTAFGTPVMGIKESNGTTHYVSTTWTPKEWVKATATFTISAETAATFYLGATGVAGGSGTNAKLFIDYVKISKAESLDLTALTTEITTAKNLLATYESGTEWYASLNTAISTAEAAQTAAKTASDVEAAVTALKAAETAAATAYKKSLYATLADGDYLVKNVKTGKYLGGANAWGTQASLLDHATRFTLKKADDGTYTFDSHTYNSNVKHFLSGGYVDSPSAAVEVLKADGGYYLFQSSKYYGAPAEGTVVAQDATASDASVWNLVSLEDAIADLSNATSENPIDATFLVKGASVSRNLYNASYEAAWTVDEGNTNKNLGGGNNENQCAESFHSIFNIHQTISGVPDGVYTLTAQAFYRQDGTDDVNLPSLYINKRSETFPLKTGSEGDMASASTSFSAGNYTMDPVEVFVDNGEITLGVKNETNTNLWCIWDNFVLTYKGAKTDFTDSIKNADLTASEIVWGMTGMKSCSAGIAKASTGATYDFNQAITLPAGQYKMTAQAAYRYSGSEADEYVAIAAGTETHYAKAYAAVGTDSTIVNVKNRWEGATDAALEGTSAGAVNGKYVPNSSNDVLTYMKAGQYDNEVIFNITEEGQVVIGIKKTSSPSVGDYTTIGAWKLERLGRPDPTAAIKANIVTAESLKSSKMQQTVLDALTSAMTAANTAVESSTGIDDANTALKTAITDAKTSISAYANADAALAGMALLLDSTNVYTAEALKVYYTDPKAAYEAGTLTTEECNALQNPYKRTDWHKAITCDNLLLSSWDTEADKFEGYYINTWSSEGEGDGSGYVVPFFEYWTGDGDALATKTLTATMTGIAPGKYDITSLFRPRVKNGAGVAPKGIAFQVNDGDVVNVCDGAQIGTSQFYLKNATAQGTVGTDSVLTIKVIVSDSTNVSWLAFKNVKYTKVETVEYETWSIVGNKSVMNGTADWAETETANDMTTTDGVNYTITVTDKTLEKGTKYEYKFIKDHAWTKSYPQSGNTSLTVDETAIYTIVYTVNITTGEYTAVATKTGEAQAVEHAYSIAGSDATLFGASWSETNTSTDMTKGTDGIYTWTANNVTLSAGTIKFKVVQDHSWGVSYGNGNSDYSFAISADGTYDVTITFDLSSKAITATATAVATGIDAIQTANAASGKFIKNGKVVIVKNGKQYSAAGALLK